MEKRSKQAYKYKKAQQQRARSFGHRVGDDVAGRGYDVTRGRWRGLLSPLGQVGASMGDNVTSPARPSPLGLRRGEAKPGRGVVASDMSNVHKVLSYYTGLGGTASEGATGADSVLTATTTTVALRYKRACVDHRRRALR